VSEVLAVLERVSARIAGYGRGAAMVAFSGGVDSSVVLAVSARTLGATAVEAVTAVSPSYPAGELEAALAVAKAIGVSHRTVRTGEVRREAYARNDESRCFHCKTELYGTLRRLAGGIDSRTTVLMSGANADDADDFRPGLWAAAEQGVRNPLLEEGIGKSTVRSMARQLDLAVADKPALACLSSRIAFGHRITPELLGRIDRAEQAVRDLGFSSVRVRHLGERATIEVDPSQVAALRESPQLEELLGRVRGMGWPEVSVDPRGYRTGSLNPAVSMPLTPLGPRRS
jgi:pyridinium-3,5-biscarboxylic acid mononucleotide sulfurtransferase